MTSTLMRHDRLQIFIARNGLERSEPPIGEIPQPRAVAILQQGAEGEHMVGGGAGVGEMRVDCERGPVVHQSVQNVGRFVPANR